MLQFDPIYLAQDLRSALDSENTPSDSLPPGLEHSWHDLRERGRYLERHDLAAAQAFYQDLRQSILSQTRIHSNPLLKEVENRIQLIQGEGSWQDRSAFLADRLVDEALNPVMLGGFMVGGLAAGLTRNTSQVLLARLGPHRLLRSGWGNAAASGLLAYTVEVPSFVATTRLLQSQWHPSNDGIQQAPWGQDLLGAGIFLGALKLSGLFSRHLVQGIPFNPSQVRALQMGSTFLGIYGGQRLEETLGLMPSRTEQNRLTDSIYTYIQLSLAGRLLQGFQRPVLHSQNSPVNAEPLRNLTLQAQEVGALMGLGGRPPRQNLVSRRNPIPNRVFAIAQGEGVEALHGVYEGPLNGSRKGTHGPEIVRVVRTTPSDIPNFHEKILQALSQTPSEVRGTERQLFTVDIIKEIFVHDALRTAGGSFQGARMQLFLEGALRDGNWVRGRKALWEAFQAMERGNMPRVLDSLFEEFPYGREYSLDTHTKFPPEFHRTHRNKFLKGYSKPDRQMISNFIARELEGPNLGTLRLFYIFYDALQGERFSRTGIESALATARHHPQGRLVLRRLANVLAMGQGEAKIRELSDSGRSLETFTLLKRLQRMGRSFEERARRINGTEHTAYIDDMRLARKVVTVLTEVGPLMMVNQIEASPAAHALHQLALRVHSARRAITPADLRQGLELDRDEGGALHPRTQQLLEALRENALTIEVLGDQDFQNRLSQSRLRDTDCQYAFFQKNPGPGLGPTIWIRDITRETTQSPQSSTYDSSSAAGREFARQFRNRVKYIIHEGEHWRHLMGNFFGPEAESRPSFFEKATWKNRMATEIMARLEEYAWAVRHRATVDWELARRYGQGLAMYYRGFVDTDYYGPKYDQVALEVFSYPSSTEP